MWKQHPSNFKRRQSKRGGVWHHTGLAVDWKTFKKTEKFLKTLCKGWLYHSVFILSPRQFPLSLCGLELLGVAGHDTIRFITTIAIFLTTPLLSFPTYHNFPFILLNELWLLFGLPNEQRSEKVMPGKSKNQVTIMTAHLGTIAFCIHYRRNHVLNLTD